MSKFANLKTDGLEESEDRLGGFQPFKSNIYTGKIKQAYAGASEGGAQNVTVILDLGGKEYRETIYITNKKGENFYLTDNKKKAQLPGFTTINDLCIVATGGKELHEIETEEKMVKIYDPEQKKEVPQAADVLVDLIGQEVSVAIIQKLENKQAKNSQGVYEPISDSRTVNNIEKVFDTDTKLSVAEARNGKKKGEFWDAWLERNEDQVRDVRKIKDGQAGAPMSGRPGAGRPVAAPQAGAPPAKKGLFGNKSAAA